MTIRNEAEAREIVERVNAGCKPGALPSGIRICDFHFSEGYLAAITGPEVKEKDRRIKELEDGADTDHIESECVLLSRLQGKIISEQKEMLEKMAEHIRKIGALAGHPDAIEGCRHICSEVKEANSEYTAWEEKNG